MLAQARTRLIYAGGRQSEEDEDEAMDRVPPQRLSLLWCPLACPAPGPSGNALEALKASDQMEMNAHLALHVIASVRARSVCRGRVIGAT